MSSKNFKLVNCDTDSIMVCKADQSAFTEEEQVSLTNELNSLFESGINWELEGTFKRVIIFKTKNYILYDGEKITYKGSSVKSSTKEPALKQFIKDIIDEMLNGTYKYEEVYHRYVKEIVLIEDIKRWASRKTISASVMAAKRTNEAIVKSAIAGTEYVEGDRAYFFYKSNGELSLVEDFKGDYDVDRLLEKLFKTSVMFNTVIPKGVFINYSLKRSKEKLKELIG